MNAIRIFFVFMVAVVAFSACSEKKQPKNIIATKPVAKKPAAPVKMQDYDHQEIVDWVGGRYTIAIHRSADTSLPMIVDNTGAKYYDNRIVVSVKRSDGSVFFDRTFSKADFSSYVDEDYLEKSALLGIVFDSVDGDNILLAASVGAPDVLSDDYMPLLITLSRMGSVSIQKDTRPDGIVEDTEE